MLNKVVDHPLRGLTIDFLLDNGHTLLESPLAIGDISVEFDHIFEGPQENLSLVVVVDRPISREPALRLYWQIQRLVRALDAVKSRRTITVVLLGGADDARLLSDLQSMARVLIVDDSLPLRRLLAPLLRLAVPDVASAGYDGIGQLKEAATGRYSVDLLRLIAVAGDGGASVEAQYSSWIENAFPALNFKGGPDE